MVDYFNQLNPSVKPVMVHCYSPCSGFRDTCTTMQWNPAGGHVPRGFCGATGQLDEVELVLIVAEPGDPHLEESYENCSTPEDYMRKAYNYTYRAFKNGKDQFHRNLEYILKGCWPDLSFDEQMRKVWITESVLCSARVECGNVPATVEKACCNRFLKQQIALFPNAKIWTLGGKAYKRASRLGEVNKAYAIAPPGCNHTPARPSWNEVIDSVKGSVSQY